MLQELLTFLGARGAGNLVTDSDYMNYFTNPSEGGQVFYPISIEKKHLMKYARENDGSPNSILSAAMFRMCSRVFPDAKQLSGGIVCNYREDVGCADTYRDLVRILHARYRQDMKDWPMEKLSTVTRGSMYLQMQPEISRDYYKNLVAYREKIDRLPDRNTKAEYALKNSPLRNGAKDTFQISYVGNLDMGELSSYIKGIYSITEDHLMLEVNTTEDMFCISFQVLNHDTHYLQEFLKVLQKEGISYQVGAMEESNLPQIILE